MIFKRALCFVAVVASILLAAAGAWAQILPTSITISPGSGTYGLTGAPPSEVQFTAQSANKLPLGETRAVADGTSFTCALLSNGTVECWGLNNYGQLGDGSTNNSKKPVAVQGLTDAVAISAGPDHACAVLKNGKAECWGRNNKGQLGDGSTNDSNKPVEVTGLSEVVTIAAGSLHTCAVRVYGSAYCWGRDKDGELGLGNRHDNNVDHYKQPQVVNNKNLTSAVAITAGVNFSCALKANGKVYCWGRDQLGQLGVSTHYNSTDAFPTLVQNLSDAVSISSGSHHTCALRADGKVFCWGYDIYGQLGDGTTGGSNNYRRGPVGVRYSGGALMYTAAAIAVGNNHSCARLSTGDVRCWGRNNYGQLGDGDTANKLYAVLVSGLPSKPVGITAGGNHTCALLADGTAQCWGADTYSQLGDGATSDSKTPVAVTIGKQLDLSKDGFGANEVAAGQYHSCALLGDGTVKCWGRNNYGQLGNGSGYTYFDHPSEVLADPNTGTLLSGVMQIAAGANHTCALLATGNVECWGLNNKGQLGDGSRIDESNPVPVSNLLSGGVVAIAAGGNHTCALIVYGNVYCWGADTFGELGNGSTISNGSPKPLEVKTASGYLSGVTAIAVGGNHTCARLADGTVSCWGLDNYYQLGFVASNSVIAKPVSGLSSLAEGITAGAYHTCARLGNGTVWCWGDNNDGQLGNPDTPKYGSDTLTDTPVEAKDLTNAATVSAGNYFTCARLGDGKAKCWGSNNTGQLGDGTGDTSHDAPTLVKEKDVSGQTHDLESVAAIAAGGYHTCALLAGGTVKCWGRNNYGQLGNNTIFQENTAVPTAALVAASPTLKWSSSNTTVATIDASGLATITGVEGSTNITATVGSVSATVTLTISHPAT